MLAKLNRKLFETSLFDSGAFGLATSIAHRFPTVGTYTVVVRKHGKKIDELRFEVCVDTRSIQLDIDVAKAQQDLAEGADDFSVSPNGYVVFHGTSGSGWSVHVSDSGLATFDSTRLTRGDIFALNLLEPSRYKIKNAFGGALGSVEVDFTKGDVRQLSSLKPVVVTVGKSVEPQYSKLVATQGLVFRVDADARIVISREEQRGSDRMPESPHRRPL